MIVCSLMGLVAGRGQFGDTGNASLDFIFQAWARPSGQDLLMFLVAGTAAPAAATLMARTPTAAAAPGWWRCSSMALVLAALWGFVFWGEVPGCGQRGGHRADPGLGRVH